MNYYQHIKTPVVFVTGPTGVGKTQFVDVLSLKIPIEIINMDVGQLYAPLSIGTAKPDWKNHPIPHHLFDYCEEPRNITVAEYRMRAQELIILIQQRGKMPVFVGGSLFYLKSLFFPVAHYGESSTNVLLPDDPQKLWDLLHTYDPVRAQSIDANDVYRLNRALEIIHTTGVTPSSMRPVYDPIAPGLILFLTRDRSDLYTRINIRTQTMIEQGWEDEVRNLDQAWKTFLCQKKLIGYNEIITWADPNQDQKTLVSRIQQRTRMYAKRQETFWRSFKKQLMEAQKQGKFPVEYCQINLTSMDLGLYLKQLELRLMMESKYRE